MDPPRPPVDFFLQPEWRWPAWKFNLDCPDLFTTLHSQFNTGGMPIQDFEAFHHDVCEAAHEATSADQFYQLLSSKKQQRLEELSKSFRSIALQLTGRPHFTSSHLWAPAIQFFRTRSLDSLVSYLSAHIPSDERPEAWPKSEDSSSSASDHQSASYDHSDPVLPITPPEGSEERKLSKSLLEHKPLSVKPLRIRDDGRVKKPVAGKRRISKKVPAQRRDFVPRYQLRSRIKKSGKLAV